MKILGKDCCVEDSISRFENLFKILEINIKEVSWLNPIGSVFSVHICCEEIPYLFTNGKGSNKKAALASAYGEFAERLLTLFFFADFDWDSEKSPWYHHPQEKWFSVQDDFPSEVLTPELVQYYQQDNQLDFSELFDRNSRGRGGICCVPYYRENDKERVYFPQNIISNLYVSNGMSCGNSEYEAKVQALSEILERFVKNKIISTGLALPEIPKEFLKDETIKSVEELQKYGFEILIKDASLGGDFPVIAIVLINPEDGGCFASFGAHPIFEVAIERTLTELLQGRALESLKDFHIPTTSLEEVANDQNIEEHFIDSNGLLNWSFFKETPDYPFVPWNFEGDTKDQFLNLVDVVSKAGYEIYTCDYSKFGEKIYRMVIPGMSEIYPLDDLKWNNDNKLLPLRDLFLNLPSLTESQLYTFLDILNDNDVSSEQCLDELLGIRFISKSTFDRIKVSEVRVIVLTLLGQMEEAQNEIFMGIHSNTLTGIFWKAMKSYIELFETERVSEVWINFIKVFGQEVSEEVCQLVEERKIPKRYLKNQQELKFFKLLKRVWSEENENAK